MTSRSSYTSLMPFSPARLRGHRDGLRLSTHEVAYRCTFGDSIYEQIEAGEREVTHLVAQRLASALDVPLAELYSENASYEDDYADAALQHTAPMSNEDIDRAAKAIHRVGHTTTVLDASGEAS